jgi:hypothetical protein
MKFYFVYSSGGGAGDWNGIDRTFIEHMPPYFKDHLLLKFGDIFFNHRSSDSIIKPEAWRTIRNARCWVVTNTGDQAVLQTPNMIMDVGTSKLVSYLTRLYEDISEIDIIKKFDYILDRDDILNKYCEVIRTSNIQNAVTFDIPNLFKVRTQEGSVDRNVFSSGENSSHLMRACAKYANIIHAGLEDRPDSVMTFINANWSDRELDEYLSTLDYTPTKLAIGGLTDYPAATLGSCLQSMDRKLHFGEYNRVHFLGAGGLKKASIIKNALGNNPNFSVDNTTAYNRVIDGAVSGSSQSGYYDYATKKLHRVKPDTVENILQMHERSLDVAYFSLEEMREILNGILMHQSHNSSPYTYECRAKLIMHNFDVYRYNAE